jgi:hypothetical protein
MSPGARWPRAEDLAFEPEIASLALLEAASEIAIQALIARNPELLAAELGALRDPPQARAARNVIARLRDLDGAVRDYRDLARAPCAPATDIPF